MLESTFLPVVLVAVATLVAFVTGATVAVYAVFRAFNAGFRAAKNLTPDLAAEGKIIAKKVEVIDRGKAKDPQNKQEPTRAVPRL